MASGTGCSWPREENFCHLSGFSAGFPLIREEEFAKQLRLARYLAGAGLGRPPEIEKAVEKVQSITKPKPRAKTELGNKKGVEAELARERRRAQQVGRLKGSSSGPARSEKQRSGPRR